MLQNRRSMTCGVKSTPDMVWLTLMTHGAHVRLLSLIMS
jgi:hypothetical protein